MILTEKNIKNIIEHKGITVNSIIKSALSGGFRGFLMGLLVNGIEGAITFGTVLAIINPVVASVEQHL
jgi:hypothetical protein